MKRGIELSINMLVTIILGVIILSSGIYLTQRITSEAQAMGEDVPRQLEDRLFNVLLGPNDRIAVLENVRDGEQGDEVIFPIGLQNLYEYEQTEFQPTLQTRPVVAPTGFPNCVAANHPDCPKLRLLDTTYQLNRFEKVSFLAVVDIPDGAPGGEYTFDVTVHSVRYNDGAGWQVHSGQYAKTKVHVNVY